MARLITEPWKAEDTLIMSLPEGVGFASGAPPDQLTGVKNLTKVTSPQAPAIIPLPAYKPQIFLGSYYYCVNITDSGRLFYFYESNSFVSTVLINAIGKWEFRDKNFSLLATGSTTDHSGIWGHAQIDYLFHSSLGHMKLYLSDILEIDYSGDTAFGHSLGIDNVRYAGNNYFASLYINDTVGDAPCNELEGVVGMKSFTVIGDSAAAGHDQWDRSSGTTGWDLVSDVPYDIDNHCSSILNGQKQFFTTQDHGLIAPTRIRSWTTRWIAHKISIGAIEPSIRWPGGVIVGTADYPSTVRQVGVGPTLVIDRRLLRPDGASWTLADLPEVGITSIL